MAWSTLSKMLLDAVQETCTLPVFIGGSLRMADWFHRDCITKNCYWMIPGDACQSTREEAMRLDPTRTMPHEELYALVYPPEPRSPSGLLILPRAQL